MNSERYKKGMKAITAHLGQKAESYVESIREVAPKFADLNVEFAFGDIYDDSIVDAKTRELCTIAALTVQGSSLPQLKIHIEAGLRCGATQAEIAEIITQMLAYCGFPAATNAIMVAKEVFKTY